MVVGGWSALKLTLAVLAIGLAALALGSPIASPERVETGHAQTSLRSYVPVAPRGGLPRPVSLRMAVPGSGVVLSGMPTSALSSVPPNTPPSLPDYLDVQSFELSYDGSLTFELSLRGDLAGAPPGDLLAFDLIGRSAEVARQPALAMEVACQLSPRSSPKQFTVLFDGFPSDELIDVGIRQIGGDEQFNDLAPVSGDTFGRGQVSFFFFSDQTKDWLVTGTARATRAQATTTFRTSVGGACPTPVDPVFGAPPISDGPRFFANAAFDLRVARVDGTWGGELRRWDGRAWQQVGRFASWQAAGRTVRMTASLDELGVGGDCLTFGGLSQGFPVAGSPLGKALLLDPDRGPLGSFCLNPDSGSLTPGRSPAGQIVVEAWTGCGGSDAGRLAPACPAPLLAGRGAAQATGTPTPPHLVAVTSNGASPSACTTPTVTATDCPPVGMSIWIRPNGTASLQPYTGFGLWSWVVTTSPPIANGSVTVTVFPEDYGRIPPLRIIPIGLAENQALLRRYRGTFEPQGGGVGLNAAGVGVYTYSGVELSQLYRHMVCDLRGLFTFSQLPLTFHDSSSANKFILNIGVAYDPTYRCP